MVMMDMVDSGPDVTRRWIEPSDIDPTFRPGIDRSQALSHLRSRGWTDVFCATCRTVIGRAGLWEGRPYAIIPGDPNLTPYHGGKRIPLWCPGCRRGYDGHTANSLINRCGGETATS